MYAPPAYSNELPTSSVIFIFSSVFHFISNKCKDNLRPADPLTVKLLILKCSMNTSSAPRFKPLLSFREVLWVLVLRFRVFTGF